MSRKDYVLIADALRAALAEAAWYIDRGRVDGVRLAVEHISHSLARERPRFDRDRFMAAVEK